MRRTAVTITLLHDLTDHGAIWCSEQGTRNVLRDDADLLIGIRAID
jgi:hypothetical protein